MADFTLTKPDIDITKELSDTEQVEVKDALTKQGCILIHPSLTPIKNDYVDDNDRGSVDYTEGVRNYSFHKVKIPDKTEVRDCNFTQWAMNTSAITGSNISFINCNLVNNTLQGDWTTKQCNTAQVSNTLWQDIDGLLNPTNPLE